MQKLRDSFVCIALSLLGVLRAEAQDFTNGGFETTTNSIPANGYLQLQLNSTWLPGWTVGGPGGGDLAVVDGTTELAPYEGSNWVVFGQGDSAVGASLSQTFGTVTGDIYAVGFAVGQAGADGNPSVSEIVADSSGDVISSNLCVPVAGGWTPFSFEFTATTTNTTLTFLDTSSTTFEVDVALDGVTVTPENGAPVITSSPASVTTTAWELVTFTAAAATTSAVQWYYGTAPLSGATNTNFTVIATLMSAGNYAAVFSNSFGTATSIVAVLTVIPTLLTNGSFEAVTGAPIPAGGGMVLQLASTWLTGWTVGGPGGNMEVYNGDNDSLVPYDGQQFVVFNQGNTPVGGSLSQVVSTTAGEAYRLTFVEAETEVGVGAMSVSASVLGAGGATLASNQFAAPSTAWFPCQLNFTADSTNTTVVFTDTSSGTEGVDVAMDDAVLEATFPPTVLTSPTNLTVQANSTAIFTASATNVTSIEWYEGTNAIADATSGILSFIASSSSAGNYSAVFSNSFGSVTSAVATLTVVPGPFTNGSFEVLNGTVISPGTGQVLAAGATWLLGWTVGGPDDTVEVVNGNADFLSPYQGQQFVIFNAGNTPTGGSLSQTFATAPGQIFIVTLGVAKGASGAGTMSISPVAVAADGSILASNLYVASSNGWTPCQFMFTATTTNTTLVFTDTSTATIAVDVALDNITVTGFPYMGGPFIIVSPTNQTVGAGTEAVFTALAGGSPSTVQWYLGTNAVPGATNGTLDLLASDTNTGIYSATFSNSFGTATTTNAVLTVVDPPVILVSPTNQTVSVGAQVSFSASASGVAAALQWFENSATIPGATNLTLAFAATAASAGLYTATFSNVAGTATTAPATLTVLGIPFTNGGFEVVTGGAIPVGASRTLTLGADWLVGWTVGAGAGNMEVFNGSGDGFSPFEGQQFVIFNPGGAPTGGVLSQTFNTVAGQIYDILFVEAKSGAGAGTIRLTATATASNGALLASNVCVATSSAWSEFELVFIAVTADTTLKFTDTSTATLAVDLALDDVILTGLSTNGLPVVVESPIGLTVNAGANATLSALASGAPSGVTWYQDGSAVAGGTNITLTFTATDVTAGNYRAVFSNSFGSATTAVAAVTVIDPPVIITSPASQSVMPQTGVFFNASAGGSPSSVQWYHGTNAVPGATNDFLAIIAGSGTAGYYTATFSNSAGIAMTAPAVLTVLNLTFTNGSFEIINRSPITPGTGVTLAASDTWLTGWTVGGPGGNLGVSNGDNDLISPFDGQQFVIFNGGNTPPGGSLSQTFGTTVGQTYAVSWVVSKTAAASGNMSVTATALAANGAILASNLSAAPIDAWTEYQFGFTAVSSNTTLVFTDTSTSTIAVDVALDDVIVSAQPVLTITNAGLNAILSWPVSATNFVLQNTGSLAAPWSAASGGQQTINSNTIYWTVPIGPNNAFYRLRLQ